LSRWTGGRQQSLNTSIKLFATEDADGMQWMVDAFKKHKVGGRKSEF